MSDQPKQPRFEVGDAGFDDDGITHFILVDSVTDELIMTDIDEQRIDSLCDLLNRLHTNASDPRYDSIVLRAEKDLLNEQQLGLWRELAWEMGKWVRTADQDYEPTTMKVDCTMNVSYGFGEQNWPTKLTITLKVDLGYDGTGYPPVADGIYRVTAPTMDFSVRVRDGIAHATLDDTNVITPAIRKAIRNKEAGYAFAELRRRWKAEINQVTNQESLE